MAAPMLSRRCVLTTALIAPAVLAVGCTTEEAPRPRPQPDPDEALRDELLEEVGALVALYTATIEHHPRMAAVLRPLKHEHEVHLRALRPRGSASASATPRPPGTPSATSTAGPSGGPVVPDSPGAARAALSRAENEASQRRVQQLGTAKPALARLIASIGASEAAHSALLRGSP